VSQKPPNGKSFIRETLFLAKLVFATDRFSQKLVFTQGYFQKSEIGHHRCLGQWPKQPVLVLLPVARCFCFCHLLQMRLKICINENNVMNTYALFRN
jgi:hypothetical protein